MYEIIDNDSFNNHQNFETIAILFEICSIIETTIISFLFVLQSKSPSNSNLFVQYKNRTILSFKKSYFNIIKSILNK